MSALPVKADIAERDWHVRFVPKADGGATPRSPCANRLRHEAAQEEVHRRVNQGR